MHFYFCELFHASPSQYTTRLALMRPMHNMMVGLKLAGKYKMALNDLYVDRVQGLHGVQNPCPREIVRTRYEYDLACLFL